jgi:hypothetical protein
LSIPITRQERQFNGFAWAIRMSPLLVAIILGTLWIAGTPPEVPDLRLSAPLVAQPGTSIGLRAWQLAEDENGFSVILAPDVVVELRNDSGLTLARTELLESLVQGREGRLGIPPGIDEVLTLAAHAEIDGREVSVERTLYVREGIESHRSSGREVTAFQAYELGPIRLSSSRRSIAALDPRVEEGVCVPELRCWLLVWVGEEDGRVRIRPLAGVQVERGAVAPTDGFVRVPLFVAGSEARVDVELLSPDGGVIAAREVRLPLVPGGLVARTSEEDERIQLNWEQLGDRSPVLIDAFDGHRWVRAFSLAPEHPYLPAFGPGVWRLQVRSDLFSENTAAVRYLVIADPGGPSRIRRAADAVLAEADREGLDPLAVAVIEGTLQVEDEQTLERALFAIPSFDVVSTGAGASARVGADEAIEREQELRRWKAAAVILLIGLMVSMVLLRVELLAQARARQLLDELGDGCTSPSPGSSSGRGLWAFVLLVFVLMALLALSKRWF